MDFPGKLFTPIFEMLTSRSFGPPQLTSGEHRPEHALDFQHTGMSSTGDFTGPSNHLGLSPLRQQIPPASESPFLSNVEHALPALLATYTPRNLAISSFVASYPTIKRERVIEVVDEAIDKLENIWLHDFFPEI
jgi:hypothetical protein